MTKCARKNLFICYSHRDEKYRERLHVHLASLKIPVPLDVWDDRRILPGALWQEEINDALLCAKVAILLVSADFLASKFIVKVELPSLLAAARLDGVAILPVILSDCRFAESELSQFQAVNTPSKPLAGMKFNDREKVWVRVANTVNQLFLDLSLPQETMNDKDPSLSDLTTS